MAGNVSFPNLTLYAFTFFVSVATKLVTQSDTIRKGNAMMIVVRDTFQAKFGKAGALVALFKELRQQGQGSPWIASSRMSAVPSTRS